MSHRYINIRAQGQQIPSLPALGICTHCPRINKTGRLVSNSTGRKYKSFTRISCCSSDFIYCISCKICGKQYVGQTKNQLRIRLNNHISTIKNGKDTPLARHMNRNHQIFEKPPLSITIIQLIRSLGLNEKSLRDKWKNIWIGRLHTICPHGLNIQD